MQKYYITLIIIFVGFIYFSCEKKEPTNVNNVNNIPDSTSHEFEWQFEYFGDGASSYFRDVCIIDENDIWAVGEIYLKDSTGAYINPPCNVVRWNGLRWELNSIKFQYFYGKLYTKAECIFALSENEIIISSGGSVMHWDGQFWKNLSFLFNQNSSIGSVYKIWGISVDNIFGVGLKGSIIHYDGSTWQKLESGTNLDLFDIWGAKDPASGEYIILAVGSEQRTSHEKVILKIDGNQVEKVSGNGINWRLGGVWFDPGKIYYVVGCGIYSKTTLSDTVSWGGPGLSLTEYTSSAVRGNHKNDIFIVGAYGDVLHYNGKSWRSYREETGLTAGSYLEVAVKGDLVVAVGRDGGRAVILRGRRKK